MTSFARHLHNATYRFISAASPSMRTRLLNAFPSLIDSCCAPGKPFIFKKYLGEYSVWIDRTFPIECEMCSAGFEKVTMEIIRRFVRRGDTCVDVGANVGAVTFALAQRAGSAGRVFSFEPGPPTFERLKNNLALNPQLHATITPIRRGLADLPGTLHWQECAHNRGNAELGDSGVAVEVTTLDTFAASSHFPRLDFLKIDVEGMEFEVLKGAQATLQQFHPVIYFETMYEFEKRRGFDVFTSIENFLAELGYALFAPHAGGGLKRTDSRHLATNTLALPEHRQPADLPCRARLFSSLKKAVSATICFTATSRAPRKNPARSTKFWSRINRTFVTSITNGSCGNSTHSWMAFARNRACLRKTRRSRLRLAKISSTA